MLEGLESVNWSPLHDAYGSAAKIPELIRALISPNNDVRERARYDFINNLAHQGTRCEASGYAIPFLCELVKAPSTPDRSAVMRCLLTIALGHHWLDVTTLPYPHNRFDVVEGMIANDFQDLISAMYDEGNNQSDDDIALLNKLAVVWERDAYTAMAERAGELLPLTFDDDPLLAGYALSAIPWFTVIHQKAVPVLIQLLSSNCAIETQATAILTAGLLQIPDNDLVDVITSRMLNPASPRVLQLTCAIALAFLMGTDADSGVLDILVDAENWREEMNVMTDIIPYNRPLMGFQRNALSRLGL